MYYTAYGGVKSALDGRRMRPSLLVKLMVSPGKIMLICGESAFRRVTPPLAGRNVMKLKVIIHEAEEGGYWAEVPSIPGCATQGESFDELLINLYEAVNGCLSAREVQL